MSWLEKVKKYVKQYSEDCNDDQCFVIVPKEEIDGIKEWLENYINTNEGSWLWYDLQPSLNTSEYYILVLHL